MAATDVSPQTDKDLASIAEAWTLARAARQAQSALTELSQQQIDAIVTAMADAVRPHAEAAGMFDILTYEKGDRSGRRDIGADLGVCTGP